MNNVPCIKVPQRQLRDKFNANEGGYPKRMQELRKVTTYDQPASPKSGQAIGTRSRIDKYYDSQQLVMVLHYFLRPDGSLGGSGKYDPKKLLIDGVLYWTP